jgi:hypothetical protein
MFTALSPLSPKSPPESGWIKNWYSSAGTTEDIAASAAKPNQGDVPGFIRSLAIRVRRESQPWTVLSASISDPNLPDWSASMLKCLEISGRMLTGYVGTNTAVSKSLQETPGVIWRLRDPN